MAKEISYKAGSKKRHDSLYKVRIMRDEEVEPKTIQSEAARHIEWLKGILSDNGIEPHVTMLDVDEDNIQNFKPIVLAALQALEALEHVHLWAGLVQKSDSSTHSKMNDWKQITQQLMTATQNMLFVQEAVHETAILDLKRRSRTLTENNNIASQEKKRLIELCKPKYLELKAKKSRLSDWAIAGELRAWLIKNGHGVRGQKQINRWIKEFK